MQHMTTCPINQINSCEDNHLPIRLGDTHTSKETPHNIYDMMVFTFNNTILLKGLRTHKFLKDTGLIMIGLKFIGNICPTIIRTDLSNNYMKLSLNHLQKMNKNGKYIRLTVKQINPSASSVIINECYVISMIKKSSGRRRTPNIRMYKIKNTRSTSHMRYITSTSMFR